MKALYVETSAVLRWLLHGTESIQIISAIGRHKNVVSSVLTKLETERALLRAELQEILKPAERNVARGLFAKQCSGWYFAEMTPRILERASQKFPLEPVRSLDAIHLATALELLPGFPEMKVLSFDNKIMQNLTPLGLIPA